MTRRDTIMLVGTVKDASGAALPGAAVEASSPALIEKTRSVVSGGTGQYSIENLRPGTYTVTFTLTGFAPVKRVGIELAGTFVAMVNADLKLGGASRNEGQVLVDGMNGGYQGMGVSGYVLEVGNAQEVVFIPRDGPTTRSRARQAVDDGTSRAATACCSRPTLSWGPTSCLQRFGSGARPGRIAPCAREMYIDTARRSLVSPP